jgi:hypothetical protein
LTIHDYPEDMIAKGSNYIDDASHAEDKTIRSFEDTL